MLQEWRAVHNKSRGKHFAGAMRCRISTPNLPVFYGFLFFWCMVPLKCSGKRGKQWLAACAGCPQHACMRTWHVLLRLQCYFHLPTLRRVQKLQPGQHPEIRLLPARMDHPNDAGPSQEQRSCCSSAAAAAAAAAACCTGGPKSGSAWVVGGWQQHCWRLPVAHVAPDLLGPAVVAAARHAH
eukprot:1156896-Pelagomonas_calceolata.AAC.17